MDDFFYVVILLLLKHVHLEPFTSVKIVNNTVLRLTCLCQVEVEVALPGSSMELFSGIIGFVPSV